MASERERAAAEARAAAAKTRSRLAAALAASVLLSVALGGGGFAWVRSQRDGRAADTAAAVNAALTRDRTSFGSATFAVELASMAHETQYTRLFRS